MRRVRACVDDAYAVTGCRCHASCAERYFLGNNEDAPVFFTRKVRVTLQRASKCTKHPTDEGCVASVVCEASKTANVRGGKVVPRRVASAKARCMAKGKRAYLHRAIVAARSRVEDHATSNATVLFMPPIEKQYAMRLIPFHSNSLADVFQPNRHL